MNRRARRRVGAAWIAAFASLLTAAAAEAAAVRIFRTSTSEAFLKGESDGVAVESGGALVLAPAARRLAAVEEPFAFALAPRRGGWAVATGNDGKLLAIDDDGSTRVLYDADEPEIFALAADRDGALLVGTSPNGKVVRIAADGESEVLFDPDETYVWGLARAADGALWVATGDPGRLYRLRTGKDPELVWEGGASHVRSLLATANGDLYFGTAGDGRVLRWRDGSIRTLVDSPLNEVAALAPAPGGAVWVALLSSEASFVDLTPRAPAASSAGGEADAGTTVVVVADASAAGAGSRPSGSRGPRSELWRLQANGTSEKVWTSDDETIFALLADGDRLWVGTGLDGRLYRFEGDRPRVEREFDAKQVVALAAGPHGPLALTANAAELWQFTTDRQSEGTFTSPVLDAGQLAHFGVLRWIGETPKGTRVRAAWRSGFASDPDATWTEWSAPQEGDEQSLAGLDPGRFVQYRLTLDGDKGAATPRVVGVELSYRQDNVRPTIDSLTVLDPGQILVPAGFNPLEQLFEPASPNRQGIFDTLRPASPREDRQKSVWRLGWQTLRWDASDANGDDLRSKLEVRPDGDPGAWLELAHELDGSSFTFDASALPDGVYRFRVTVDDSKSNVDPGAALSASRESEAVVVDHTPPEMRHVRRNGGRLTVTVYDAWSPVRTAEVSIDGGEWQAVRPADGLLDGRSEDLVIDAATDKAKLVLLRLTDAAFNVRTYDLLAAGARK